MDNLANLQTFVHAADTRSFVETGRLQGISASAAGKCVARLEHALGVRLFHRSTRS
ncbi:LysR family transcriptional regulator, partial [Pseudomonas syringae pv. tagetis]